MPLYEADALFGAIGEARERARGVAPELRAGVEELLTIALTAAIVPTRLESLTDVLVDCAPDVKPVISSLIAALVARPRDEQRKIFAAVRPLLAGEAPAVEEAPFAGFNFETFDR